MLISDVLKTKGSRIFKIRDTDTMKAAAHAQTEHGVGALLVEDSHMRAVGMISERDLVKAVAGHGAEALEMRVRRFMGAPLITCKPSDRVDAALAMITVRKIRHLPVMDGDRIVGMISIGDLVKHRLDEKELETNVLLEISRMRHGTDAAPRLG